MSVGAIFLVGILTTALIALFVILSVIEMRHAPEAVMSHYGEPPLPARPRAAGDGHSELARPAPRPLRILVATDGSHCSDLAVQSAAMRPWPRGSEIEVVSVAHARVPAFPDPQFMVEAAHVQAQEAERQHAPGRVERARRCLDGATGVSVTGKVLEGDPRKTLLEEAERWNADVVMVGSHGHGPIRRGVLGSVSEGVARHAHCSVEIVRCPHEGART